MSRLPKLLRLLPTCLCSALALGAGSCMADTLVLAGGSSSRDADYAYLGAIIPIGSKLDENGLRLRLWLEHLHYNYGTGATAHTASATGSSIGVGYRYGLSPGSSITLGIGARYRDTRITLPDPANRASGGQTTALLSLDGQFSASDTVSASFNAEYVPSSTHAYWSRVRVPFTITSGGLTLGPEAAFHGSSVYHARQFGLVLGGLLPASSGLDLNLLAGTSKLSGRSSKGYGGVELGYRF